MLGRFFAWFLFKFLEGLGEVIRGAIESAWDIICKVVAVLLAVITFPLWIVPFIYWYFNEYEGKEKKEPTGKVGKNHKEVPGPDTEEERKIMIETEEKRRNEVQSYFR
jgi:hypothetical protein